SGSPWASSWETIATGLDANSPFLAVSHTPTRVDVFVGDQPGTARTLWGYTIDLNQPSFWSSFQPVQPSSVQSFQGAIAAVGRLPTHLDVFVIGLRPQGPQGAAVVWSSWQDDNVDGGSWHPWYTISDDGGDIINAQLNAKIAAVSRIPTRIDLFV